MKSPSYADDDQRKAFAAWLKGECARSRTSANALAKAMGRIGTHDVKRIFEGEVLPLPSTLRAICQELNVPWFVAFANAGYYHSILLLLNDLVQLATRWCTEDGAYPPPDDWQFRSTGVLSISGESVHSNLIDGDIRSRYIEGKWSDEWHETRYILPKPLALAIMVGVAGFPRRGDIYKNDKMSRYAADVLSAAVEILQAASVDDDSRRLKGILEDADRALRSATLPFASRRAPAAEYIVSWCDNLCSGYTHYARLAVYAYWGEVGSNTDTVTPYVTMPQIRDAAVPQVSQFQI